MLEWTPTCLAVSVSWMSRGARGLQKPWNLIAALRRHLRAAASVDVWECRGRNEDIASAAGFGAAECAAQKWY